MVLMPIADHVEMGLEDKDYMVEKISNTDYYNDLFINAFGDATVSADRISDALVHFILSMISSGINVMKCRRPHVFFE
jgi:cytochrome c peroxidase